MGFYINNFWWFIYSLDGDIMLSINDEVVYIGLDEDLRYLEGIVTRLSRKNTEMVLVEFDNDAREWVNIANLQLKKEIQINEEPNEFEILMRLNFDSPKVIERKRLAFMKMCRARRK